MRLGLELEVSLFEVIAVISFESPLDVDRMCIMTLNKVTVVTVHCPNQVGQGTQYSFGQASSETGSLTSKINDEINELVTMTRIFSDQQRLHQSDSFAPVFRLTVGRLNVRFFLFHISNNI